MNLQLKLTRAGPDRPQVQVLQCFLSQAAGLEVVHQDIGAGSEVEDDVPALGLETLFRGH